MARPKTPEKPKKTATTTPKPKRAAAAATGAKAKPAQRGASASGSRGRSEGDDEEEESPDSGGGGDSIAPLSIRGSSRGEEEPGDEGEERDERDGDPDVIDASSEVVEVSDDDHGAIESIPASKSEGAALSRTDPLQAYLREVQRHKLLTPDEEKELTTKYATTQDIQTAARLVTANLRLVVKLAYEYRRAYKNIMDLIQEGNIGLMQAVKRFDPYRGVKLSSYAAWWIRAYILRFILNNWRLVKLGTTQAQRKLFFNLNKEKAKLAAMGIDATPQLIAENLGVEEQEVIEMDRRLSSAEASLDAPVGDAEGRSVARIDLMPSAWTGPDVQLERSELGSMVHERLQEFRTTLKGKDIVIFDKRMVAEDPLTLQELGTEFGVSRERVRQLEARLTSKLRDYLSKELGDAVMDQGL